jgi:hypothetical protein
MVDVNAGLCARCQHARVVESRRGGRFLLCERSRTDPSYRRYPSLPVLACPGFEGRGDPEAAVGDEPSGS